MINNVYELILGMYIAIILFFMGYYALGDYKEQIMENKALNWVFMGFFIILFFLLGYLVQNIILSFQDVKKKESNTVLVNTNSMTTKTI